MTDFAMSESGTNWHDHVNNYYNCEPHRYFMKLMHVPVLAGSIIMLLGIIFSLQGRAVVGPESSFMYSSPDWVSYGVYIAIMGMMVLVAGMAMWFLRRARS